MSIEPVGALLFGWVVGWITYRTLRRKEGAAALSDISTVLGAVGGAAITSHFGDRALFSWYCVGLFVGFFLYFLIGIGLSDAKVGRWMGPS
jgi:uncharacterized membrane protein YeaQ/YmgE (transglycosylase-associated protein family)